VHLFFSTNLEKNISTPQAFIRIVQYLFFNLTEFHPSTDSFDRSLERKSLIDSAHHIVYPSTNQNAFDVRLDANKTGVGQMSPSRTGGRVHTDEDLADARFSGVVGDESGRHDTADKNMHMNLRELSQNKHDPRHFQSDRMIERLALETEATRPMRRQKRRRRGAESAAHADTDEVSNAEDDLWNRWFDGKRSWVLASGPGRVARQGRPKKANRVDAGMRYAGIGKKNRVGAGMRYAGIGKKKRLADGIITRGGAADAGMRYMGIGKRPTIMGVFD